MRELAVQAVNGTNNALDRAALDAEVQQLKSEIDRTAKTTQFNSINLLDGSFKNKVLQIGDDANETLKVGIAGAKVSDLGMGTGATGGNVFIGGRLGFTATSNAISAAFNSGGSMALVINGTVITAIKSDTSGSNNTVKDINDVVTAINNSRAGVTASAFNEVTAAVAGSGIIASNGLTILVSANDTGSQLTVKVTNTNSLEEVVAKINAQGGESSVQAKINDEGKLVLFNNSGATINVTDATLTSTLGTNPATGFATTAITGGFRGMLKLESLTDSPVSIGATGKLAGLAGQSDGDINTALGTLGLVQIKAVRSGSVDTVKATAQETSTEELVDGYTYEGAKITTSTIEWIAGEIKINGVDIYRSGQETNTTAKKVNLINSFADQTGVFATRASNNDGVIAITLNSVNNRPISVDLGNEVMTAGFGGYDSHGLRSINVGDDYYDGTKPTTSGGAGNSIVGLNVLSAAAATNALGAIDNAIEQVSQSRANLGAYQNRLVATVNNLTNVVTNTEQSKSRIMDTDYSKETTKLARSQIIQQAATAMLAQANQQPQMVLSLLK